MQGVRQLKQTTSIYKYMNKQNETWVTPEFEDLSVSMECTAYSETLD